METPQEYALPDHGNATYLSHWPAKITDKLLTVIEVQSQRNGTETDHVLHVVPMSCTAIW